MPADAGLFGPSSYEDCILENMRGVSSDRAATNIARACRTKFPAPPEPDPAPSPPQSSGVREIPSREWCIANRQPPGSLCDLRMSLPPHK